MYRSSIGNVSVEYRWFKTISTISIVDRYIGRLSPDMSTESTYSTHDPSFSVKQRLQCLEILLQALAEETIDQLIL